MSSTLFLRTLLIASALSGAFVFACTEDTPSSNNGRNNGDDDDDDNADDDDDAPKKDAGKDAGKGAGKDSGKDSGGGCTGFGEPCEDDEGNMGFAMCNRSTGELGECLAPRNVDAGPPVDMCPEGFICRSLATFGAFCSPEGASANPLMSILRCMEASECEDQGLTGATCTTVPMLGGICQLPCTPGEVPEPSGDAGTGDEEPEDDAGSTSDDAGSDAGSSSSSDAGRDS